jgi:hypothetical protein
MNGLGFVMLIFASAGGVLALTHRHAGKTQWYIRRARKDLGRLETRLENLDELVHSSELGRLRSHLGKRLKDDEARVDSVLLVAEQHIALGEPAKSSRLMAVLGKYLRQTLYASSDPYLPLGEIAAMFATYCQLLTLLSGDRLQADVDDGMLSDEDRAVLVSSFGPYDWAFDLGWDLLVRTEQAVHPINPLLYQIEIVSHGIAFRCFHPDHKEGDAPIEQVHPEIVSGAH